MNKRSGEIGIIILMGMFMISGCATDSYRNSADYNYADAKQLTKSAIQRFDDLPVPAGFNLYRKQSFIFQNNKTRMGTMTYIGSADIVDIIEFYKKQMPLNAWGLLTSVEFDRIVMSFEKDSEACIISVEKPGRKVIISISLSPVSKGAVVVKEKYPEQK